MVHLYSSVVWMSLMCISAHLSEAKSTGRQLRTVQTSQIAGIVLPDRRGISFKPVIPEKCKKIGICDNVPGYPNDYVSKLIDKILATNSFKFNEDKLIHSERLLGGGDNYIPLCETTTKLYRPQAASTATGAWYFIINNEKKKAQQKFLSNICENPNASCNSVANFPPNYNSSCQQEYIQRNMIAIDYQGDVLVDYFNVPNCCSCVYKMDY